MNARELHDDMARFSQSGGISFDHGSDELSLVVRALDLLARVEESEDELVRELRDQADEERQFEYPERAKLLDMAAAALVALRAERDRIKAHAEAMANGVEGKVYYADAPDVCEAVDAYRRDFPKDAP